MSRTASLAEEEQRRRDEDTRQPEDELSEYEMERRRTMERNHRRLQELGLVGQEKVEMAGMVLKTPKRSCRAAVASPAAPVAIAVRKSLRTRSKPAPSYTDNAVGFDDESRRGRKRSRVPLAGLEKSTPQSSPVIASPPGPRRTASKPLPPDSSRNLECDVDMLMEQYLGRRFHSFGKAPVMELSTKSCPPRFSRMSGVTEWKNAVFLWVNVDGGASYANLFEGKLDAQALAENGDGPQALVDSTAAKAKSSSVAAAATSSEEEEIGKASQASDGSPREDSGDACSRCQSSPRGVVGAPPVGCEGSSDDAVGEASANVGRGVAARDDAHGRYVGQAAGLRMTWFAGGRMTAESALIQRLLRQGDSPESEERYGETVDTADAGSAKSGVGKPVVSHDAGLDPTDIVDEERKISLARPATADTCGSSTSTSHGGLNPGGNGLKAPADVNADRAALLATAGAADDAGINGPVPESIFSAQRPKEEDGHPEADAVLLFCRLPNEPYVFCGRLGYSKHWSDERPVRFVWRLLDAVRLAGRPDFRAIVEAAGIRSASSMEKSDFVK